MPDWLQELLEDSEAIDQKRLLEMNKLRADQALAAIAVIEQQIAEAEQIAEQEVGIVTSWKEKETTKLQNKINWLAFNLEKFIRSTDESTITLAHGVVKMRKSRDKIEIVDPNKFKAIGQRHGLLRHIDATDEPDMTAIRAFIKMNGGKPPLGVLLTPGQPKFSYSTNRKGESDVEEQTETGITGRSTDQIEVAA